MTPKTLFVCVAAASLCSLAPAAAAPQPLKVTSTLDDRTVLPHRIYWLGYPSLPAAKVAKVDFLIDGKLSWTEHHAPYVYGADDNGRNRGYLVTSWLAAGMHRFTVRITATDGTTATDTVAARRGRRRSAARTHRNLAADDRHDERTETGLRREPDRDRRPERQLHAHLRAPMGPRQVPRLVAASPEQQDRHRTRLPRRLHRRRHSHPPGRRGDLPSLQRQPRRRRLLVPQLGPARRLQVVGHRRHAHPRSRLGQGRMRDQRLHLDRAVETVAVTLSPTSSARSPCQGEPARKTPISTAGALCSTGRRSLMNRRFYASTQIDRTPWQCRSLLRDPARRPCEQQHSSICRPFLWAVLGSNQ
jgi:hypothetical protein